MGRVFKPDLPAESEEKILLGVGVLQLPGHAGGGQILPAVQLLHRAAGGAAAGGLAVHAASGGLADLIQTGQQQGVEGAAVPVMEHGHCLLVGVGRLAAALVYQHIVGIGQGDDLGGQRDPVALQAVGVALTVPALVVPAADLHGVFGQLLPLIDGELRNELGTDDGVALDDLVFLRRQTVRLFQQLTGDHELADVVEAGGHADRFHIGGVQRVYILPRQQAAQQQTRQAADAGHVASAAAAAVLHGGAEDGHHLLRVLLVAVRVIGHDVYELLLLGVQQDGIDDAAADDACGEGAVDVVRRAQLKGAVDIRAARLRRDHDGGDRLGPAAALHLLQHLKAVHLRHDDVQQQGRDLALVHLQRGDGLMAVHSLDDLEIMIQHIGQHGTVHLRIICDQQFPAIHAITPSLSPDAVPSMAHPAPFFAAAPAARLPRHIKNHPVLYRTAKRMATVYP